MHPLSSRNKHKVDGGVFRPQITSLVDVMTILLFFLIKSFSVDSTVVTPPPNVELPLSTSEKGAQSRCAVTITKEEIIADDRVVANVADIERSDSLIIEPLHALMKHILPQCMVEESGSIVIVCDKDVNFAVVKKVMSTCSRAGISDFSILVIREGEL
ncbi:MAG: biopolymer transporter ExbD [Chitinispirillales bacterium]|jgi:biopolymer transport protein ExbD|nr:biopolymer transporter ExbD [Chitinispirillales bacterium]